LQSLLFDGNDITKDVKWITADDLRSSNDF